ncbi:MAG: transketolase [Sedimentisphaerales bacterium]|nr:transketolase [Sedimentisphaerales bacterium]
MTNASQNIDVLCADTIRLLAADAVQAANSGHPGMPMGMATPAYLLWSKVMKHNPANPDWVNRDRFILSAGHGSMLIYSLLHLTGYDLSIDDLKNFRQIGSKTPGHPEFGHTPGVEVTTGPLGQGIANGVGMAIAQQYLAATFNQEGFDLFDFNTFVICGDGCLQEGISSEAASLAGHLGLGKLIVLYDDNGITIDGETDVSFTEDVVKRFEAFDWQVIEVPGNGNDVAAITAAIETARSEKNKPSLIKIKTVIGFGSPNLAGQEKCHGAPLGADEIKLVKQGFGWDPDKSFYVPAEVSKHMNCLEKGGKAQQAWNDVYNAYKAKYPELAVKLDAAIAGKLDFDVDKVMPEFKVGDSIATRKASQMAIGTFMPDSALMMGGSADLTGSNLTNWSGMTDFQKATPQGRYLRFGVREHAMGAIMNGIAATKLLKVYGSTFLVFSDYLRGAMRVAAISKHPVIYVYTHDSIGVGEDGPTHQPVEQIASMRAMPGMTVFRPADSFETAYAWQYALKNNDGPVALCLTRQNLPNMQASKDKGKEGVARGAYIVVDQAEPDVLLLATGSEVELAVAAAAELAKENIKARVVSMPSLDIFDKQDKAYKDAIVPPSVRARVAVEAGIDQGWHKYIGLDGKFVGMTSFGISGPAKKCFEYFNITTSAVVKAAKEVIANNK